MSGSAGGGGGGGAVSSFVIVPVAVARPTVALTAPERFRLNAYSEQIDSTVPNADCSEATYEGIRSENIQPTLSRIFSPVDVYTRNCFLWRLLNQTYSDNYDLSSDDDVAVVRQLVAAEITHFMNGGTPTELHAAYRPLG